MRMEGHAVHDDAFYVPALEDVRTQVGKPGAYTFESVPMEPCCCQKERA